MSHTPATSSSRFSFLAFAAALLVVLGAVGGLNYAIDPLWYAHGNQLSGKNFPFNERISKINLLKRTAATAGYDCLILGSSRVTSLRPSQFVGQTCFNLSLKGAEVAEFVAYAKFARELGVNPKTVYVSVDDFNFLDKKETERRSNPVVKGTPNVFHAFFSADVLLFSLMTLANVSPDPDVYFDADYEAVEFPNRPYAEQVLVDEEDLRCDLKKTESYLALRDVFPQATLVGYAPPMGAWHKLSDVASRGVLDCGLEAYHRVAMGYDRFLDFTIPTSLTEAADTSYDGHHFSPAANDQVAAQLIGARRDLALDVKSLLLADYRAQVHARLRDFLARQQRADFLPVAGL